MFEVEIQTACEYKYHLKSKKLYDDPVLARHIYCELTVLPSGV
jgi:hypothetical protein